MNDIIEYSKEKSNYGNPLHVKKICEWCKKEFWTTWKTRNKRFDCVKCVNEWKIFKSDVRENINCKKCGKLFIRNKNRKHWRNGAKKEYCCKQCWNTSSELLESKRKWIAQNQPMNNPESVEKIKLTKLKKYGNASYNNPIKNTNTCLERYGVPYVTYLSKCQSAGKTISKFQRKIFENIKEKYNDALLEYYLSDVNKSVDIYIPSKKLIIECFGDYWHCNPIIYKEDFYNKNVHLTAKQIWDRDKLRINNFKEKGYAVEIVWESSKS